MKNFSDDALKGYIVMMQAHVSGSTNSRDMYERKLFEAQRELEHRQVKPAAYEVATRVQTDMSESIRSIYDHELSGHTRSSDPPDGQ